MRFVFRSLFTATTLASLTFGVGGFIASTAVAQITDSVVGSVATIHIQVQPDANPKKIPNTVFGSFLEPIGHSTYGGLWSDVLENPSFEENLWSAVNIVNMLRTRPELRRASDLGLPLPWEPLLEQQGSRYLPVWGDAANSNRSLLIMSLPDKEVGVRQAVYLPVKRELAYTGSVWLKQVRGAAKVKVSLRAHNHAERVFSTADLDADSTEWTKYSFHLTLQPGQLAPLEPVDFVIALRDDARVLVDEASLLPDDNVDGMDPEMIAMARELHSKLIRFGGNFTSAYDWSDGIGPRDKRVSKLNISWGMPEYNTFGTDEFLDFCRLIHAQPQIALNLGTDTPQHAAEWVQYINQHWEDHHGGLLWELGNELWGDFQVGYPTLSRVAAITKATSDAVHKIDPTARLIATGGDEDWFHDWNAAQFSNPPGTFDYLSTHFVVNDDVQLARPSNDFKSLAMAALPIGLEKQMHAIHDQIQQSPHRDHVTTAFTEWLAISNGRVSPSFSNMGGAVFAAGFLNMVIRNSDIVPISDMTGIIEFGGIWKKRGQVYPAPAYWVLREYAQADPQTLLHVQTNSPTYSVAHGVNRLPEISGVPYLDVVAAESGDGKELVLLCVNRHLTQSLTGEFDLSALIHTTAGERQAKAITLASSSILDENSEEDPGHVKPESTTEKFGATYIHRFPSSSVTVVHIPMR